MKKGFSLTEILVSVAIIGILSGVGIEGFIVVRQRARLEEDVAQVVMALRKAQNSALSPSTSETGVPTNQTLCAIIVKIESGTINFYYGSINTLSLNKNCNESSSPYLNFGEIKYSSISNNSASSIKFDIPFADTTGGQFSLNVDGVTKTIEVTNTGLIKVQ
ncbi:MAG: hypothetical protein RJB24_596 [Candidatus Parcubacteria bacterium]|jgi:prepilin-type N-terminal cleavage/methylation domain-containing protein